MAANDTITEILRTARESVEAAGLPDALKVAGFERAVDLLAASPGIAPAAAGAVPDSGVPGSGTQKPPTASGPKTLERIAAKLSVGVDLVDLVYEIQNGELAIVVPSSKLEQKARPAMRQLILLTAVGRQAGGWDDAATLVTTLREVCEHYGGKFYDTNNFTNAVKDQADYLRQSGGRKDATVRVLPSGYTRGGQLIAELVGAST